MSNRELEFILRMRDEATRVWEKTKGAVSSGAQKLKSMFSGLGGVIAGAFSVLAIRDFVKEANNAELANARLAQSLRNAGVTGDDTRKSMIAFSQAMQKVTTVDDDTITKTQALLVAMTGLTGTAVQPLTRAALDLAAGLGIDAESAGQLIAKTIAGQDALGRYGISVKGAGSETEKMAMILDKVRTMFGGMAENEARTAAGRMKQFENSVADAKEELGKFFASVTADLLPSLQAVLPVITKGFGALVGAIKAAFATLYTVVLAPFALIEKGLNMIGVTNSTVLQGLVEQGVIHMGKYGEEIEAALAGANEAFSESAVQSIDRVRGAVDTASDSSNALKKEIEEKKKALDNLTVGSSAYIVALAEINRLEAEYNVQLRASAMIAADMGKKNETNSTAFIKNLKLSVVALKENVKGIQELGEFTDKELTHMQIQQQGSINLFYQMAGVLKDTLSAAFAGEAAAGKKFLKGILLSFIDTVQGMVLAAGAAAIVKGVLTFGTTVAGDLAAVALATIGLQAARHIVSNFHQGTPEGGVRFDAPPTQDIPIMVRGGETVEVRTETQQARNSANITVNIYAPGTTVEMVKEALQEGLRLSGLTIDQFVVNNRKRIALS